MVERLDVPINRVDVRRGLTFGDLAQHYAEHELVECSESIRPKAHTTIKGYERVLRNRLLPRWGYRIARGIEPLEVEQWLRALKKEGDLANPTLDKTCRVMSLVYRGMANINYVGHAVRGMQPDHDGSRASLPTSRLRGPLCVASNCTA